MAFQKTTDVDNYGYTAEYWRPTTLVANFKSDATVSFQVYIDEAGRIAGNNPAPGEVRTYNLTTIEGRNPLTTLASDITIDPGDTLEDLIVKTIHVKIKEYAIVEQALIDDGDPATVGDEHLAYFHDAIDLL